MLIRFDPFRELDRLTEQLASTAARVPRAFPMDAYRRGDQFIVEFDLPGVEPDVDRADRREERLGRAVRAAL